MDKKITWWKNALVYQIYPLSFKDSNGDGIGDLRGIIESLDYLKDYGVDVIWLSPVYQSPMDDNGYDISDYYEINPMFGTMDDLKELISKVHQKGMKIIMDLVVNHTSDEHHWFKEARSSLNSPVRDYYIWRDEPKPEIGSVFSGSAWTFDSKTNQYYFHLFSRRQPDLNWQNPHLRNEIYRMMNKWLDMGIDGFRMDVIELIGKDIDSARLGDGPYLEIYLNEMYENCFKGRDIFTVGEMGGISVKRAQELTSQSNLGLNMTFQFSHLGVDQEKGQSKWHIKKPDMLELKKILSENQIIFMNSGWNSLFLSNHDQPRQVTRFGNDSALYRIRSSQMLFTMLYGQKGTPYVYQGEEIGMTGIVFDDIDQYKDIETINWYHEAKALGWEKDKIMASIAAKGRDNSRTPFQWNESLFAGFSNHHPWLSVNPNYLQINAKKEMENPFGIYHYTKTLFEIRKKYDVFSNGDFTLLYPEDDQTFIYLRQTRNQSALVVTNMTDQEVVVDLENFEDYKLLLANVDIKLTGHTKLKPYAAAIYIKERKYDN